MPSACLLGDLTQQVAMQWQAIDVVFKFMAFDWQPAAYCGITM